MTSSRRSPVHPRDQAETHFSTLLRELVARVPGARAAALVDAEGETVDYGGEGDPFDVRVSAAHWQLVLKQHRDLARLGQVSAIVVRAEHRSFIARHLPEGYAVVVTLRRRAGFSDTPRAFLACERGLCLEAGWTLPTHLEHWFPVDVVCDPRGRPLRVEAREPSDAKGCAIEVLGLLTTRKRTERGFRVRLSSGAEVTLVREHGGFWYSEEPLREAREPRVPRKNSDTVQIAPARVK